MDHPHRLSQREQNTQPKSIIENGTGVSGDGGPALQAQLSDPQNIFIDGAGNIFIADNGNRRIRKVDATTGIITTIAGNGSAHYLADGIGTTDATLWTPSDVFVDTAVLRALLY